MKKNGKIKVAIIGVGNCASSLVQGVEFYKNTSDEEHIPGLMHTNLGGYHIRDIEFTAAFDVNATKVGKDLSEAIWADPNNTIKFSDVPHLGVPVHRGMTHDGIGKYLAEVITKAPGPTADITGILKSTGTQVVVNYLPVGAEQATKWYVEQILNAGCAFVNCIPVFIAREDYWQKRFMNKGLPIIGDDIKSQVGATITHRVLTRLFEDRGVRIDRTYQLNFGGNTDFLNMLERDRLESKKISKTNAVTSQLPYEIEPKNIHVGPSDYVPWLTDRKWANIRIEGTTFGNVPLSVELKLEVWDSPNSAGVVIDAIRCARLALDHGLSGALTAPSSYFMKSPPVQVTDDQARQDTEEFIRAYNRDAAMARVSADAVPSSTAPTKLLLYWLVRAASLLLSIVPVRLSYALAGAIGEAYCVIRPSHSRWAAYNLSRVLNEPPTSPIVQKVARQSFGNYARVLVDFFRLPYVAHDTINAQASVRGLDELERAAAYGKGFILVTGHMGSWDRAGAVFTGYGYNATFLVDTFSPPALDQWVTRMRRKFAMKTVAVEKPGALREMYRVLQRNEALVLLIDTPDPRGIPATFFGEETTFPAGVAQLAIRAGCPVVVAGLFRRPDFVTYDGFCELIPPTEPGADAAAAMQRLTQQIVTILERAIVAHPDQWYSFRPMWPTGRNE